MADEENNQLLTDHASFAEEDDSKKKKAVVRKAAKVTASRRPWRHIQYGPNEKSQVATEITNPKGDPIFSMRFDVAPEEAIDYFKRRQVLSADKFYELETEAKAGAFAIGNVYQTDVTSALQNELIDALQNGRTQIDVINRLREILAGAGHKMLGDAHLETVFRTTTQMAYGVGRRNAQEEAADFLPIWEYTAVGDDRTRPTHMALDGLQYPVNHPFWDRYYPPWEFRCRCSVIPRFDIAKGYDPSQPNSRTTITKFDEEGLPENFVADGQVKLDFSRRNNFAGVPRQANLEAVLKTAAQRALDSRSH